MHENTSQPSAPARKQRLVKAGEVLIRQGDKSSTIGIVLRGVLKLRIVRSSGDSLIVGLLFPSDLFGSFEPGESPYSVESATEALLCCHDRPSFEQLLVEDPAFGRQVFVDTFRKLNVLRAWAVLASGHDVKERVAAYLLAIHVRQAAQGGSGRQGSSAEVVLPISWSEASGLLGTTPETVSRIVRTWKDAGVLRSRGTKELEIPDVAALRRLAGDLAGRAVALA